MIGGARDSKDGEVVSWRVGGGGHICMDLASKLQTKRRKLRKEKRRE
jgi:hypothetical protein